MPDSPSSLPVIVSGIQPSGTLHLGNYLGAIRQNIALANDEAARSEAFLFIVDYHALTTLRDREALRRYTVDVALDYLALGLDPDKASLFVQSDIPQLTELTWIFLCLTPSSQLEKGVSYKDKVAQGLTANGGLLTYPILQAADILAYTTPGRGLKVPVGADQKQNLEISRDTAGRFNLAYRPEDDPLFPLPDPYILDEVSVIPGLDGRKMSKSYGNTIGIFDEGKALKKKVMSILSDSTPLEAPKDPDADHTFALLRHFASDDERDEIAAAYRAGGYGYGHAKKALLGMIDRHFGEARERRDGDRAGHQPPLARVQLVVAPADRAAHEHGRMRNAPPDLLRLARHGVDQ